MNADLIQLRQPVNLFYTSAPHPQPRVSLVYLRLDSEALALSSQLLVAACFGLAERKGWSVRVVAYEGSHVPNELWTLAKLFRSKSVDPEINYLNVIPSKLTYPLEVGSEDFFVAMHPELLLGLLALVDAKQVIYHVPSSILPETLENQLELLSQDQRQALRYLTPNSPQLHSVLQRFNISPTQIQGLHPTPLEDCPLVFEGTGLNTYSIEDFIVSP